MTLSYYDRFALIPKRCDKCNRLFWLEPYNLKHTLKGLGLQDVTVVRCKRCEEVKKVEND